MKNKVLLTDIIIDVVCINIDCTEFTKTKEIYVTDLDYGYDDYKCSKCGNKLKIIGRSTR